MGSQCVGARQEGVRGVFWEADPSPISPRHHGLPFIGFLVISSELPLPAPAPPCSHKRGSRTSELPTPQDTGCPPLLGGVWRQLRCVTTTPQSPKGKGGGRPHQSGGPGCGQQSRAGPGEQEGEARGTRSPLECARIRACWGSRGKGSTPQGP